MTYNPEIHHRRSIRLKHYDYSRNGAYYVTMCTKERECLFGEIDDGPMDLNQIGKIVESVWNGLTHHYGGIELDAFVVMPNHAHGIIVLSGSVRASLKPARTTFKHKSMPSENKPALSPDQTHARSSGETSTQIPKCYGLSEIVRAFKTFSSREINAYRKTAGLPVWQRNYYERVICDEKELDQIRKYIVDNPFKWEFDHENPNIIS